MGKAQTITAEYQYDSSTASTLTMVNDAQLIQCVLHSGLPSIPYGNESYNTAYVHACCNKYADHIMTEYSLIVR